VILLDSNILLRLVKTTDPAFPAVSTAVTTLLSAGDTLCIVPQNLYEFWAVATRPAVGANGLGLSIIECRTEIARFKRLFHLLRDPLSLFRTSFDARLVAAMRPLGIVKILTLNGSDFTRFPGITIIDPTAPVSPQSTA
jgi:predicted nucleic acid-binding protein